jgi:hypothetical protein
MKPNGDFFKVPSKKTNNGKEISIRENDSSYKAAAMMPIPNNLSNFEGF